MAINPINVQHIDESCCEFQDVAPDYAAHRTMKNALVTPWKMGAIPGHIFFVLCISDMQRQLCLLVLYQALWQKDAETLAETCFISSPVPVFQDISDTERT